MTLPLIVGTTVLLASAGYWLVRVRPPHPQGFAVFACPRCDQKLRYPKGTRSQTGMCPRCGRSCTLPGSSPTAAPQEQRTRYRVARLPVPRSTTRAGRR